MSTVKSDWKSPPCKADSLLEPWRFRFLNEEHTCLFPGSWNNKSCAKLWLYNLHYFDDLQSIQAKPKHEWHIQLIEQWITDNHPGKGNGWDPYPLSLRIINWIKWSLNGNNLAEEAIQSLAVQTRYLFDSLEYHLPGNHLIANAKALIFSGLFFQGREPEKWFACGIKILRRELSRQVMEDGGHFERSPMYHAIIIEDFLDIINIMRTFQCEIPVTWYKKIREMFVWMATMNHPDGQISLFNDAAFSIASLPTEIQKYWNRLGFNEIIHDMPLVTTLLASGYIRWQQKNCVALLDVGAIGPDNLPGHGHADTLSFELSLFGQRVIVDSGTSCYGIGSERNRQRETLAHNTITVDGKSSSEVWGGFRVARRAKPYDLIIGNIKDKTEVTCSHDGYRRLPGRVIHTRKWIFQKEYIVVKDTLIGKAEKAVGRFHFHPDIKLTIHDSGTKGEALLLKGKKLRWIVSGASTQIVKTTYHPEFGVSLDNLCLEILFLSQECEVIFIWDDF